MRMHAVTGFQNLLRTSSAFTSADAGVVSESRDPVVCCWIEEVDYEMDLVSGTLEKEIRNGVIGGCGGGLLVMQEIGND